MLKGRVEIMKFSEFTYKRPILEKAKEEMANIITTFKDYLNAEEQIMAIRQFNIIRKNYGSAQTIAQIRHTQNVSDSFYNDEMAYFNKTTPELEDLDTQFYQELLETPFRIEVERIFGPQLFRIAESRVKIFSPNVMGLLRKENELIGAYQILIAKAKIEFEGEEVKLSQLDKFKSSSNRELRRKAAEAKCNLLANCGEELDQIYDQLVKIRTEIAKKLGYENFIELAYLRLNRSDWNAQSAKFFREIVLNYVVPVTSNLIERQEKRLGIKKLKYYDESFQFHTGNPTPKGEPSWIVEQGRKLYSELSIETKELYEEMVNRELFDLIDKEGKAETGYCTVLWQQSAPFIFANFNGTANDIRVLVHEIGHAIQVNLSLKEQEIPEYFFPTLEAAEILSMSMEFFAWPWLDLFFQEDAEKYKLVSI
jgi:M3 family oligoendopeptidase